MKTYRVYECRTGRNSRSKGYVDFGTWDDALGYVKSMVRTCAIEYCGESLHTRHDVWQRGSEVVTDVVLVYDDLSTGKARDVYKARIVEEP